MTDDRKVGASLDMMADDLTILPRSAKVGALAGPRGGVILVRHGEPALSRKVKLSAAGYRRWWAAYEEGGLLAGQTPPADLVAATAAAGVIFSSTRRRAHESAVAVMPDREVIAEPLFIEAPLPPPRWPDWIKLSPRTWGFISRVCWWFFDHHEGQESRMEAEVRAEKAAQLVADIAARGQDVVVLAHGFFNDMVGRALRARGWRCTRDEGYNYWCARRFDPS